MAVDQTSGTPRLPMSARIYARVPLPVFVTAFGASIAYLVVLAAYLGVVAAMGQADLVRSIYIETGHWRSAMVNALLVGFAPAFVVYCVRGTVDDLTELKPVLGFGDEELDQLATEVTTLDFRALTIVGAVAMVMMTAFTYYDPGLWSTRARPGLGDPILFWQFVRQAVMGWLWVRAMTIDIRLVSRFGRVADRLPTVDLLDQVPLLAFARRGLRSVFAWMALSVIFSLFWLHPDSGRSNLVGLFAILGVAGVTLLLAVDGIHRRLRDEKRARLARVRDVIRQDQAALLDAPANDSGAAMRLPALYATESRLLSVQEWPFDASITVRVLLYVTLGVGSWVGAALVERMLGDLIG